MAVVIKQEVTSGQFGRSRHDVTNSPNEMNGKIKTSLLEKQ